MTQKTLCGMRPRAKKKHAASGRAWRENVPRYFLVREKHQVVEETFSMVSSENTKMASKPGIFKERISSAPFSYPRTKQMVLRASPSTECFDRMVTAYRSFSTGYPVEGSRR